MKIEIQSHNFPLTCADDKYIRNRLNLVMAKNPDIDTVQVWLADISGGESSRIIYCVTDVKSIDGSSVVSESSDAQVHVAIRRAVNIAGWKVARNVEQRLADSYQFEPRGSRNNSSLETKHSQNLI